MLFSGVLVIGYAIFMADIGRVGIGLAAIGFMLVLIFSGAHIAVVLILLSFLGIWLIRDNPKVAMRSLALAADGAGLLDVVAARLEDQPGPVGERDVDDGDVGGRPVEREAGLREVVGDPHAAAGADEGPVQDVRDVLVVLDEQDVGSAARRIGRDGRVEPENAPQRRVTGGAHGNRSARGQFIR